MERWFILAGLALVLVGLILRFIPNVLVGLENFLEMYI